jgi:hypothetical protein
MPKNKDYPTSDIAKLKRTNSSLRAKIRQKDKKIERLISDVNTLQKALDKSIIYINDELAEIPVEDIVRYFNRKKRGKLDDVVETHQNEMDRLRDKWQCYDCKSGYLRLVLVSRQDGKHYFRMCVNRDCKNRTPLKPYHDEVEGVEE